MTSPTFFDLELLTKKKQHNNESLKPKDVNERNSFADCDPDGSCSPDEVCIPDLVCTPDGPVYGSIDKQSCYPEFEKDPCKPTEPCFLGGVICGPGPDDESASSDSNSNSQDDKPTFKF